ncbi:MAG: hypothetical protein LBC55_04925, partial [Desulfovibrio sp.]|nr:hypothetical protein [Desulfovibrio sp.]
MRAERSPRLAPTGGRRRFADRTARAGVVVILCLFAAAFPAGAAPPHARSGVSGYVTAGDSPTGGLGLYWKAFSQSRARSAPDVTATAAGRGGSAEGPRDVVFALTLLPPDDSYLYGPESAEGLPTSVQVLLRPAPDIQADARTPRAAPAGAPASSDPPASGARSAENAGFAGASVNTTAAGEAQALEVRYPPATPKKNTRFAALRFPGLRDGNPLVYAGPAAFLARFPAPEGPDGALLRVSVSGLLCSERNCRPAALSLDLALSARDASMLPRVEDDALSADSASGVNVLVLPPAGATPETVANVLVLPPAGVTPGTAPASGAFPDASPATPHAAFAGGVDLGTFSASGTSGTPKLSDIPETAGIPGTSGVLGPSGVLGTSGTAEGARAAWDGLFASLRPEPFRTELEIASLGEALFFGLLAGLILNLMPCVLPVISLKFSALPAVSAVADNRARRRMF